MTFFDPKWLVARNREGDSGCVPMSQYLLQAGQTIKQLERVASKALRPCVYVPLKSATQNTNRYFTQVSRDGLSIALTSPGVDAHLYSPEDDGLYLLMLLNGRGLGCQNGKIVESYPYEFHVLKPGEMFNCVCVKDALMLTIRVDASWLAALPKGFVDELVSPQSPMMPLLKQVSFGLLGRLMISSDMEQSERWIDEWAIHVMQILKGGVPEIEKNYVFNELPAHIQKFISIMVASEPSEAMNDLVAQLPVSSRKLYQDFQRYVGCSPYQFIKLHRLRRVRLAMMHDHSWALADLASMYGFSHLGRFSSYYQSVYGELPSVARNHLKAQSERSIALEDSNADELHCWVMGFARSPVKVMDMKCQECIKILTA
jgi:AraC-like DNA-binding protein